MYIWTLILCNQKQKWMPLKHFPVVVHVWHFLLLQTVLVGLDQKLPNLSLPKGDVNDLMVIGSHKTKRVVYNNTKCRKKFQSLSNNVWLNSHSSSSLSPPAWPPPPSFFSSPLITHHCEGHELQDASATSLFQALNALLHKTLHKLGLRSGHLGAHDGRNEEEKVGWGE